MNKKILIIATGILLITGCSNKKSEVNNQDSLESELKNKFVIVEEYLNSSQNPCGESAFFDETMPPENGTGYFKSFEFKSFDELTNYLLKYMSQDIISLRDSYKKENYLEKDGNLYCHILTIDDVVKYELDKTEYVINNSDDKTIDATVTAYIDSENDEKNIIDIVLTKNNNNWIITSYKVK